MGTEIGLVAVEKVAPNTASVRFVKPTFLTKGVAESIGKLFKRCIHGFVGLDGTTVPPSLVQSYNGFLGRLFGDNVDNTKACTRAVKCGIRTTNDFNTFNILHLNRQLVP